MRIAGLPYRGTNPERFEALKDKNRRSVWRGETDDTRQVRRDDQRALAALKAAAENIEGRAAKRKERGIAGGSRARQFLPIDLTIEAVRNALLAARRVKGTARRRVIVKCARRLYRGKKIDAPWRSYPREKAISVFEDGRARIVL